MNVRKNKQIISGLFWEIKNKLRNSVTTRLITYSLAGTLLIAGSCLFAGCKDNPQPKRTYVWMPPATFHTGAVPAVNPCSADYPLNCPGTGKCCGTNYPYLCGNLNECYASSPPCAGYITCSTRVPIITSVALSRTSIATGGTWAIFTVNFTVTASIMITETIIYVEEVGGYFEMPVSTAQNQDGFIQFPLGLLDIPPEPPCDNRGQPCYAQVPQGTTNLDEVISLIDGSGDVSSPYTENVLIEGAGGGGGGGGGSGPYCYSNSSCIPSALSNSCDCAGSTTPGQCVSGHPACSSAGGPCGDGTHACCVGETCIYNSCVSGCGQCAGIGCTP